MCLGPNGHWRDGGTGQGSKMHRWVAELMLAIDPNGDEVDVFDRIASAAGELGFEWCAFGLRAALPVTQSRVALINNYPRAWQQRYAEAGYVEVDPTVAHGRGSQSPLVWDDSVFASTPQFWSEARSAGLRHGWCQSSLDPCGAMSMLTLSRSAEPITARELAHLEMKMCWLACVAHLALGRLARPRLYGEPVADLTAREVEVLQWTLDGKSAVQIAQILSIRADTVHFHVKNAIWKMDAPNKGTAANLALVRGLLAADRKSSTRPA